MVVEMKINNIWFEFDNWSNGYNHQDDNTDVIFTLDDDSKWIASFFTYENIALINKKNKTTGECLNGLYFCASNMILIENISKENIIKVLNKLITNNSIDVYSSRTY